MKLSSIQILRAVAALMIVLLHTTLESGELSRLGGYSPILAADEHFWDSPFEAGVDLFFVISGFVMVVSCARLFGQPGSTRQFLTKRLSRIAPPYWAVTLLFLGIALLSPSVIHDGETSLHSILLSLLFIPFFRTDGAAKPIYKLGWTLNYEVFFYACFSLATTLTARRAVMALTLVFSLLVTAGLCFHGSSAAWACWTDPQILEFVLGAWIGLAFIENIRIPRSLAALLLLVGTTLVISRALPWVDRTLTYGLPAAMVVTACALASSSSPRLHSQPLVLAAVALGDASYVLYLTHPFVFRAVRLVWVRFGPLGALSPWLYIVATTLLASITALLAHRWLERPFTRWLQSKLLPAPHAAN